MASKKSSMKVEKKETPAMEAKNHSKKFLEKAVKDVKGKKNGK